jgi:hypothetical protein
VSKGDLSLAGYTLTSVLLFIIHPNTDPVLQNASIQPDTSNTRVTWHRISLKTLDSRLFLKTSCPLSSLSPQAQLHCVVSVTRSSINLSDAAAAATSHTAPKNVRYMNDLRVAHATTSSRTTGDRLGAAQTGMQALRQIRQPWPCLSTRPLVRAYSAPS